MSKAPLVPTPIVDRNGKRTTVLKKPVPPVSASALAEVKPTVAPQGIQPGQYGVRPGAEFAALGRSAKELLAAMDGKSSRRLTTLEVDRMIDDLHPETLSTLDMIADTWKHGWLIPIAAAKLTAKERNIATFNNTAFFHDMPTTTEERRTFVSYISGLQTHHAADETSVDYSVATEEEQQRARAILKVALELPNHTYDSQFRGSMRTSLTKHLVAIIRRRPQDADRIIAILQSRTDLSSRSPGHMNTLEDMLEHDISRQFTDGLL